MSLQECGSGFRDENESLAFSHLEIGCKGIGRAAGTERTYCDHFELLKLLPPL